MKDLFVNFVGAIVFSTLAFLGLKYNKNNSFINKFIPKKEKRKLANSVRDSIYN